MIPDMGKYTVTVLGAYGATIVLLLGLVALTLWRGAKVKRALAAQEERMKKNG
ncbi:MAG: heme exporter protein CcmD [Paenirhodobacter sp.]|uniref:heme exporter protein CcmD n=1 Tax=Paenirhodobacter sp. TaxID=1965326 RepID=UPI003D0F1F74